MTMGEKLLMLWIFVMVIVVFVLSHLAGHLTFVLQNCFALLLPILKL